MYGGSESAAPVTFNDDEPFASASVPLERVLEILLTSGLMLDHMRLDAAPLGENPKDRKWWVFSLLSGGACPTRRRSWSNQGEPILFHCILAPQVAHAGCLSGLIRFATGSSPRVLSHGR